MRLQFPSPAAFTQSVRMRRSGSPGSTFVIVEGGSDVKLIQPFLSDGLHYIAARGKEMVLTAYETLVSEGVDDCLFIVDCDGVIEAQWLGRTGLVVSSNRDVDADLLFELNSFERLSLEFFAELAGTPQECMEQGRVIMQRARDITGRFGVVLDAARGLGAITKVTNVVTGGRQRLRLTDLLMLDGWLDGPLPDMAEIIGGCASALSWTDSQRARIAKAVELGSRKHCRLHSTPACEACMPRRYQRPRSDRCSRPIHHPRVGFDVSPAEVARAVRLGSTSQDAGHWPVVSRARAWLSIREAA